ncbi:hypothetical protein ACHHYP_05107 [Achlya hypogyna]|uniref:Uncharacterized protein n=1 Tax=Achlya hypogyna TaxID=1202772 RepID=A0A1V9YYY3_ACHHY|nr:hypothetical protein ACHHYP_05107 [Achlya hypogyna]
MSADKEEQKRLQRSQWNRGKKERMKARHDAERQALEAQIDTLGRVLTGLSERSVLPWREVALGLRDARNDAVSTLHDLHRQQYLVQNVLAATLSMVAERTQTNASSTPPFDFLNATLPAESAARRSGLDWFSQHLYRSTETALSYAAFPVEGTVCDSRVLAFADGHGCISRIQLDYNLSLEETYNALKEKIGLLWQGDNLSERVDEDLTASVDPSLLYRRTYVDEMETIFYVGRTFQAPDHVVFVLGNLAQDARQPMNTNGAPTATWLVLQGQSPQWTRLQYVSYIGPPTLLGERLTWQEECAVWFGEEIPLMEYERRRVASTQPKLEEALAAFMIP